MDEYRFSNALDYTHAQLSEMHNLSFSGYFFPMTITPAKSANYWRTHQIDANRCVVMHDRHGDFVGMARMGTRGRRGWCGGFGIAPQFRGRGASHVLAERMVQVARESELATLQLEVLTQNTRAFKVYEKAGFVAKRRLFGLEMETSALPAGSRLQTETSGPEAFLPLVYMDGDPCWGCEPASILTLQTETITVPDPQGRANSLLVWRTHEVAEILGAVFQSELTDGELVTVLRRAAGDAPKLWLYNEPEQSPFLARCRSLGFKEFFTQYEMSMQL
ncbi:GNAT family N-acetyltransferase [Ktedonosporobacter rubrisoli]|uniref:GNAT family N-acetyltransferase n=1 Tax=Ktedonosporobacter rubrisoli TaxID=2509675 RepID=A0A4V0YZ62_KTERU|nr:GNAT family N-acetyltransferase [Ktedonosporobacter rubrisoli]QBD78611.1 GNAT family N-acetyltransferase [Ktedonosporobacter rubrisoli]